MTSHRNFPLAAFTVILLTLLAAQPILPDSQKLAAQTETPEEGDQSVVVSDSTVTVATMETIDARADSVQRAEDHHPQDSPENRGFLIVTADGKSELRLRGSIRVNGALDLNGLRGRNTFDTYEIPVGFDSSNERRFFMQAAQSRIGIEATRQTSIGPVFMRIEADFLGTSNHLRLRHAYGATDKILAGQTWSTFSDPTSVPLTVDLDGPNSSITERTVQIRFSWETAAFNWSLAVESPEPEISQPDSLGPTFQSFPYVAFRIRKPFSKSHLQLAGILSSITVRKPTDGLDYLAGYGALLSGKVGIGRREHIFFQVTAGKGISKFITALSGRDLDALFDPVNLKYELVPVLGSFVALQYSWTSAVSSHLIGGTTIVRNFDFQPDDAFNNSQYLAVNTFWDVNIGSRFGLEYTWGRRENKDGQNGQAQRFSFIFYYDF